MISLFEMWPGFTTLGSGVHCQFESTVSKKRRHIWWNRCLNLWPGSNSWILESMGPLFLIHDEQKRRHIWLNNVFEFMAGIKFWKTRILESMGPLFLIHSQQKRRSVRWNTPLNLRAGTNPWVLESIEIQDSQVWGPLSPQWAIKTKCVRWNPRLNSWPELNPRILESNGPLNPQGAF